VAISENRARRLSPVFAAHRFLGDGVGTLPVHAYRRYPDRREQMLSLPPLLDFLEDAGTLVDWCTQGILSLASQGNAIGFIVSRDGFGYPTTVQWRPRSEFFVDDDSTPGRPQWWWEGRRIERSEIVHIPWLTVPGRTLGLSPIEAYALAVSNGLSAQQYTLDWFAAGGVPPGTFKNTEKRVPQEEADIIKSRLVNAIRTREPIVYGSDWDYNAIVIPPQAAQVVESLKLGANQIAAIYGIPPEEVGGEPGNSLTYVNEEMRQSTRANALRPWAIRFENGISAVLPTRQYMKFNLDAMVRADAKSRWQIHRTRWEMGAASIDDIRRDEDQPPLPDGQGASYAPQPRTLPAAPQQRDGYPELTGHRLPELTWTEPT
jgi:HK97 family phage portal protein